jgi:hypothetical protein
MPLFYFHLHEQDSVVLDEEGAHMLDTCAARRHAILNARSIIAEDVQSGSIDLSAMIEVTDERGSSVLSVSFSDAVAIRA